MDKTPDNFERYDPQHPLPQEIRQMTRDDTVCQFCGVSYLIHNEIKALEDKLRATEKELAHFKGCEERENKLKEELKKSRDAVEEFKKTAVAKDAVIGNLTSEAKSRVEELEKAKENRKQLEEQLAYATKAAETFRLQNDHFRNHLPSFVSRLKEQKTSLAGIQQQVQARDKLLETERQRIEKLVIGLCAKLLENLQKSQSKVTELEKQQTSNVQSEEKTRRELAVKDEEISRLKNASDQVLKLERECSQLKSQVKTLGDQLEDTIAKSRTQSMEIDQYKDQLRKQATELDQINNQVRQRENASEQNIARLQKELKQKENEVNFFQRDLQMLRKQSADFHRIEEEIQRKASASNFKTEEMKQSLERAREDLSALKKEREMLISAHQDQIEQLRNSFKNRIAEAEKWPEKFEETLKKEKEKHSKDMQLLEDRLKENFVMEMQIEKQKHQELTEKYLGENRQEEKRLKAELGSINSRHKSEISELHKQLAEYKTRSRENETAFREEIESLKKIIKDLEGRLGKLDSGNETKVVELKSQMVKVQAEVTDLREENRKLQSQLAASKEDVTFLQETVRRECEERFELTEALSSAREELLALKKPMGGYSTGSSKPTPKGPSPPNSGTDNSSKTSSLTNRSSIGSRSEELALFRKSQGTKQATVAKDAESGSEGVAAPSVSLGYDGDRAKTPGKGVKGNSLSDSRKRIAQAVGRR